MLRKGFKNIILDLFFFNKQRKLFLMRDNSKNKGTITVEILGGYMNLKNYN